MQKADQISQNSQTVDKVGVTAAAQNGATKSTDGNEQSTGMPQRNRATVVRPVVTVTSTTGFAHWQQSVRHADQLQGPVQFGSHSFEQPARCVR